MRILLICADRGPMELVSGSIPGNDGHSLVRVSDFREATRTDLDRFDVALVWYALLQKLNEPVLRDFTPLSRRLPVVALLSREAWAQQRPRLTTLTDGWLFVDDPDAEPLAVIRLAGAGYWALPDFVIGARPSQPLFAEPRFALSEDQRSVLRHLAAGRTNRQIALATGLAEARVKKTVHEILGRLGLANRTQAAILAASSAQLCDAAPPESGAP